MDKETTRLIQIEFYGNKPTLSPSEIIHFIGKHPLTIIDTAQENSFSHYLLRTTLASENSNIDAFIAALDRFTNKHQIQASYSILRNTADQSENCAQYPNYIATVLAKEITTSKLSRLYDIFDQHHLKTQQISTLGQQPTGNLLYGQSCLEIKLVGTPTNIEALKEQLLDYSETTEVDTLFQTANPFRHYPKLIAFDMDSTLIQAEVIDEIAAVAGVGEEVSKITERAMRGEIDFDTSFTQRVSLLKGFSVESLQSIANQLKLSPGTERMMHYLKRLGIKTAIISGGFEFFGRYLQEKLGFDHVITNKLITQNGLVTGEVDSYIINRERKATELKKLTEAEGIDLSQTIAVGDGANDLSMLSTAGTGIAYKAKPVVKASADHALSHSGLDGLLYFIGLSDQGLQAIDKFDDKS